MREICQIYMGPEGLPSELVGKILKAFSGGPYMIGTHSAGSIMRVVDPSAEGDGLRRGAHCVSC